MRSPITRMLIYCIVAALVTISAHAQNSPSAAYKWGCSSTEAESTFWADLRHPSNLRAKKVTDLRELHRAQTSTYRFVYSRINAEAYGISRMDFFVNTGHREDTIVDPNQRLAIYLKLTRPEGITWWRVSGVSNQKNSPDEDDPLWVIASSVEDKNERAVTILPATGNRTIPIFDLWWKKNVSGMWTALSERHLLVDLRGKVLVLAADLSCNAITASGACGVWNVQHQDQRTYDCDWNSERNDFVCERTTWGDTGKKRNWFELLSGKEVPFVPASGSPASLAEFAERVEHEPAWHSMQPELPGLGKTSHLLRVATHNDAVVHIFGTYGDSRSFGGQFFYVILQKKSPPEVGYIPTMSWFDDTGDDSQNSNTTDDESQNGNDAANESQGKREELKRNAIVAQGSERGAFPAAQLQTGGDLSFHVRQLFENPQTHIYQVTATERNPRTTFHALYWLGIGDRQSDGQVYFEMPKLASDRDIYKECAEYRTEASAAVIKVSGTPGFSADIDVEPSHRTSEFEEGFPKLDPDRGESLQDTCPWRVRVEWNNGQFVSSEEETPCPNVFSPRLITIDSDGTLKVQPGKVVDGQGEL